MHAFASNFPGFLSKPVLYFAGLMPAEKSPAGIDVGFISNFNYRHIPKGLQKHYAFPLEVFRDWDTFSNWAGLYAVAGDLSAMVGISPSVLVLFAETLKRRIEAFWPYLEGKAQPPAPLPAVSCTPERLEALRRAFAKKPFSFREVLAQFHLLLEDGGLRVAVAQARGLSARKSAHRRRHLFGNRGLGQRADRS